MSSYNGCSESVCHDHQKWQVPGLNQIIIKIRPVADLGGGGGAGEDHGSP